MSPSRDSTRQQLDETIAKLDRTRQELDDLIANVELVLRGPLRSLRAAADAQETERVKELSTHLHRTVGDLMHLYRLGRERIALERVDMDQLMVDVSAEVALPLRRRHARLEVGPLRPAAGVRRLLHEMMVALITSALARGGEAAQIRVTEACGPDLQPGLIDIAVSDSGPALSPAERHAMFVPNYRERRSRGAGIELAIARKVAELHGGYVWADDAPSGGTSVHAALPSAEGLVERPNSHPRAVDLRALLTGKPAEPIRALLVEGSPMAAELVTATVSRLGDACATLDVVPAGIDALVRLADGPYDIALIGSDLADGDGLAFLADLRHRHPAVPAVMISGDVDPRHAVLAMQHGAADYLRYGDVPDLLRRVVLSVIERCRGLKQIEERRADLIGMVTHDLKNPLSNVLSYADLLIERSADLSTENRRVAARIRENCTFMFELIGDILDMRRIDTGCLKVFLQSEDLADLARLAVERHSLAAGVKDIKLELDVPAAPLRVVLDQHKISQVFNNLISNALKFSPRGAVVRVGARSAAGRVEAWVEDRGAGIHPGELDLLFKKFSRTSVRPTGGEKSTGLGLFIVKELVRLHGGTVDVRSVPGEGSTFSFNLPV